MKKIICLISLSLSLSAWADSTPHTFLKYRCETTLDQVHYRIDIYHDGLGDWGGPSNGEGAVLLVRDIANTSPMLLERVAMRPTKNPNGVACNFLVRFELDWITRDSFHLDINDCSNQMGHMDGTATVTKTDAREVVKEFHGAMSCQ